MTRSNDHVGTLIALRAELIKRRRDFVSERNAAALPDIVVQIDAVDRSIADEKLLDGMA